MKVGDKVEHCMGGQGVIVKVEPLMAVVRFHDGDVWCWLSNLTVVS